VCPVCKIFCEDTKHLFFKYGRVKEIWENYGILSIIEEACHSDRKGFGVLETILRSNDAGVPGVTELGLKELITTACWYMLGLVRFLGM
jgi:hypothetical protein